MKDTYCHSLFSYRSVVVLVLACLTYMKRRTKETMVAVTVCDKCLECTSLNILQLLTAYRHCFIMAQNLFCNMVVYTENILRIMRSHRIVSSSNLVMFGYLLLYDQCISVYALIMLGDR